METLWHVHETQCEAMLKGMVERAQLDDALGRACQGELGTVDAAHDFSTYGPCNPVLWQANNAALVEREVSAPASNGAKHKEG